MSKRLIEKYVPVVNMDGLNTNKDVTIGVSGAPANLEVSGDLTVVGNIIGNVAAPSTFPNPVTFDNSAAFNGSVQINGQDIGIEIVGNTGPGVTVGGDKTIYSFTVDQNTNINITNPQDRIGLSTTFVLIATVGGELVDFVGAEMLSTGQMMLQGNPGDKSTITFMSDGVNWFETNRIVFLAP